MPRSGRISPPPSRDGCAGVRPRPRLAGVERQLSVLFADLAGFTTFSETRRPTEVLTMLNEYWAEVVPAIEAAGGVIEQFAGDGVMVDLQRGRRSARPCRRAASTGLAIAEVGRALAGQHQGWPMFRVGINTGAAVVGDVGAADRRSFAVIGDTTNVAARLAAVGSPGQVVVARATWDELGADSRGRVAGSDPGQGQAGRR